MSIYWTLGEWTITARTPEGKKAVEVFFQGVPSYCGGDADYLSGFEHDVPTPDGKIDMRDVFVVESGTEKVGQRYVDVIARMCFHDYQAYMANKNSRARLRTKLRRRLERRRT